MLKLRKKINSCEDTKGGCFKQKIRVEPPDEFKEDIFDTTIDTNELNELTFEQATGLKEKPIGLGDRVERIAQPIARVIDRVAGTNIQGCGACQKRKEYLNKKFPNT